MFTASLYFSLKFSSEIHLFLIKIIKFNKLKINFKQVQMIIH